MRKEKMPAKIGERESTEFKRSLDMRGIAETVAAFSTAKGGTIIVGVDDDGKAVGVQIGKDTLERLANEIKQNTDPKAYPSIKTERMDKKDVIYIKVEESPSKPVSAFGVPYKRVGKSNHKLSSEEVRKLVLSSRKIFWDELVCREATIKDIDRKKVLWYVKKREEIRRIKKPRELNIQQLLLNVHALKKIDHNMKPANAGILFFGKYPHALFANSQLRIARFKGTKVTAPVIDRVDCSATVWEMVELAEEFIRKNIRLLSLRTEKSFAREDRFEYPMRALREAIINALIHRDYELPQDTRMFIFDDRVEIINAGSFPEGVDPEHPTHMPKNNILCNLMYDVGYIEKYGSGIYMMKELCKRSGNKEPFYELHSFETKIVFESPIRESTMIEIEDISQILNERQKKALEHVYRFGHVTRREYVDMNNISHKTAHKDLKEMISKGFLAPKGKGRSVRYVKKR